MRTLSIGKKKSWERASLIFPNFFDEDGVETEADGVQWNLFWLKGVHSQKKNVPYSQQ